MTEIVKVQYGEEILELEVADGTTDADIEAFLLNQSAQVDQSATAGESASLSDQVAAPMREFVRGAAAIPDLPATLINTGISAVNAADRYIAENVFGRDQSQRAAPPQVPEPFTELGKRAGLFPEERPDGVLPRFFELLGASSVPFAGLLKYGDEAQKTLTAVPGALQQMGLYTARNPNKAAAWDIGSNFTASVGGRVAEGFTDNDAVIAMAEFSTGFAPTAAVLLPKVTPGGQMVKRGKQAVLETVAPFTEAGAKPKASRRMQDVAADPEASAAALETSRLPGFQGTGDPNLIKLQNNILSRNSEQQAKFSEELRLAIQALRKEADFGGDVQRARHLLNVRQQMAVEEAAIAVRNLGQDATPRQISVTATRALERSYDDAVSIEGTLWRALDTNATGDVANARQKLSEIMAARSADADPEDIPKWLASSIGEQPVDARLMAQLQRQGMADDNGVIDPAIRAALERQGVVTVRERTLDDLITLRSRVLRESRAERAKDAPNRNKLRILNEVQESLLEDMTATGVEGVDNARTFSRSLNERFRSGRVGKLLGYDKTGADRVAEDDMLDQVVFGPFSATTTQRFIETASDNPDLVLQYIKARYLEATDDGGIINAAAHDRFVNDLQKKGMFEVFPELQGELTAARAASDRARLLDVPESQINTTRVNQTQSRAALLLQADPGYEMQLILKSNNPQAAARELVKMIRARGSALEDAVPDAQGFVRPGAVSQTSTKTAEQGLKSAFAEEVMRLSAGTKVDVAGQPVPNGLALKRLLKEYRPTMRALDMSNEEIGRLNRIAEQIRIGQVEAGTGNIGTGILDEPLLAPIDLLARFAGARAGGKMGQDMGSTLVLAQFMSKTGRDRIRNLTTSKAEELLIESVADRQLASALLVSPTETPVRLQQAANTLETALMRLESSGRRALAIAATEDEE